MITSARGEEGWMRRDVRLSSRVGADVRIASPSVEEAHERKHLALSQGGGWIFACARAHVCPSGSVGW